MFFAVMEFSTSVWWFLSHWLEISIDWGFSTLWYVIIMQGSVSIRLTLSYLVLTDHTVKGIQCLQWGDFSEQTSKYLELSHISGHISCFRSCISFKEHTLKFVNRYHFLSRLSVNLQLCICDGNVYGEVVSYKIMVSMCGRVLSIKIRAPTSLDFFTWMILAGQLIAAKT